MGFVNFKNFIFKPCELFLSEGHQYCEKFAKRQVYWRAPNN